MLVIFLASEGWLGAGPKMCAGRMEGAACTQSCENKGEAENFRVKQVLVESVGSFLLGNTSAMVLNLPDARTFGYSS